MALPSRPTPVLIRDRRVLIETKSEREAVGLPERPMSGAEGSAVADPNGTEVEIHCRTVARSPIAQLAS